MDDGIVFLEPEDEIDLWHYASKYYDPVKAKEYYERTKKLKGRKPAQKLSKGSRERQAQAKAYVREQISTSRAKSSQQLNAKSKTLSAQQKARLEKLRANAVKLREQVAKKLQDKVDSLMAGIETKVPKPKLNEIPESASPKVREYLERQNAKLMKNYNRERAKESAAVRTAIGAERDKARADVQTIGNGLKAAVAAARDSYAQKRQALSNERKSTTAGYQKDLKTELQNIEDKVR